MKKNVTCGGLRKVFNGAFFVAAAAVLPLPALAAITLTFEGVGNLNPIGNFYNGGTGTNYGVGFSPATLAIVDQDAGGTGNIANEPTADTVMFFLDSNNATLNYAAGFTTGFSFWYSSSTAANVNVWSGLGATGSLLGSISLTSQFADNCAGDPSGQFCNWSMGGVSFAGTAKSIDFGGTANQTAFDNITLGSATAPITPAVPEPETYAMLLAGLGVIGAIARRRNAKKS